MILPSPSHPSPPRDGRAAVVLAVLILAGLGVLAAILTLATGQRGETASPTASTGPDPQAGSQEPPPLVPRLDLGMSKEVRSLSERPPLESRPVTPPEERFRGTGRIDGYLDLPPGVAVPRPWTLVLEPSRVLIGGDRARPRRVEFTQGETEFTLEDVPLGGYELRAEAERMSGATELLLLARPDAQNMILHLSLRPAAYVEGVVEFGDGSPVAELPLEMHPLAGGDPLMTRTDQRGAYLFESVPDGEYRLFAGHPMSPIASALELSVSPPSLHVPAITVGPLGEIEISVVDASGLPVSQARIQGWGQHGGRVEATTDAFGQARARFLPAGRITLNAWAGAGPARRTGRAIHKLAAGARAAVEIRLSP